MSKNITIAEGTQAKNFSNVSKVRINNIGGGTSDWIPEEDAGLYANLGEASITKNGTYNASDEDYDGFSKVTVKVDPKVTTKTITKNGTYRAQKDKVDGYSEVSVQVPTGGGGELITKSINENGTYNASEDGADGYSSVTVNVGGGGGSLITKEITANGTYNASGDGADGYSSVTVNVPFPQHGSILQSSRTNAPVGQRISTSDFISDFDEKLYTVIEPYLVDQSDKVRWENLIRLGGWLDEFNARNILNYNNVVFVGGGGIINDGAPSRTSMVCMWIFGIGILDETAIVTLDDITPHGFRGTFYNGDKFTAHSDNSFYYMRANKNYGYGGGSFSSIITDINNHTAGSQTDERVINYEYSAGGLGVITELDSNPHMTPMTNLTGGT